MFYSFAKIHFTSCSDTTFYCQTFFFFYYSRKGYAISALVKTILAFLYCEGFDKILQLSLRGLLGTVADYRSKKERHASWQSS